jgi:hypothetical protein
VCGGRGGGGGVWVYRLVYADCGGCGLGDVQEYRLVYVGCGGRRGGIV